jgi:hypothetical protein
MGATALMATNPRSSSASRPPPLRMGATELLPPPCCTTCANSCAMRASPIRVPDGILPRQRRCRCQS